MSENAPIPAPSRPAPARNFIEQVVEQDVASGKWGTIGDYSVVRTRFPPEPNGYLHIGHAKSICLNFGLARKYGGACVLRFDDTNPAREEQEYVDAIVNDIRWLGFRWPGASERDPTAGVLFASDYFQQMYDWGEELIRKGLAYVDDQNAEQIRETRGTLTEGGKPSPWRDRSVEENLDLFQRMAAGEFPDGSRVLRAKIDMASPNFNLRDPVMYRIVNARHHRTGDRWHIYPMYDWAHGFEDSIEGITHSICTLEFENHRPLYDWFINAVNQGRGDSGGGKWGGKIHHPQQIEFARLNLTYTTMSKRRFHVLVNDGHVRGWDDPRMPTLSGQRRRGYTPASIRALAEDVGVTKVDSVIDVTRLENAVRDDLNRRAPRRMCVLRPLKVTITNWADDGDEGRTEWLEAINNPEDEGAGKRQVPFTRSLYIERDDFLEDAPRKWFRLAPGAEVRLRYGYWIRCTEAVKDASGEVIELKCTYDPATRGGDSPPPDADGNVRKVKGTLHWVSAEHATPVEVRLFDRLFTTEEPGRTTGNFLDDLNPDSLSVLTGCMIEPNWRRAEVERIAAAADADPAVPNAFGEGNWVDGIERFQFERQGYFCVDPDSTAERPVFNRTVTLKDTWAKVAGKG